MKNIEEAIKEVCNEMAEFLIAKNRAYGNSAQDPVCIFSKASSEERMKVRLDDKLSRIARGHEYQGDDTEKDIVGYLILKRVNKLLAEKK